MTTTSAAVSDRLRADLVERATAFVRALLHPSYSTAGQAEPAVEVLSSEERDGARVLRLLAHHYDCEYAQSGSDWADHYALVGRARVVDDAVVEATLEVVHHRHLTEHESNGYAPDATIDDLRARLLDAARPRGASTPARTLRCPECRAATVSADATGYSCATCGHAEEIGYPGAGSSAAARWYA